MSDFEWISQIGLGTKCEVYLVKQRTTGRQYALKVVGWHILDLEYLACQVTQEESVLMLTDNPFIPKLHFTF